MAEEKAAAVHGMHQVRLGIHPVKVEEITPQGKSESPQNKKVSTWISRNLPSQHLESRGKSLDNDMSFIWRLVPVVIATTGLTDKRYLTWIHQLSTNRTRNPFTRHVH